MMPETAKPKSLEPMKGLALCAPGSSHSAPLHASWSYAKPYPTRYHAMAPMHASSRFCAHARRGAGECARALDGVDDRWSPLVAA